jgi:hypothetical protein
MKDNVAFFCQFGIQMLPLSSSTKRVYETTCGKLMAKMPADFFQIKILQVAVALLVEKHHEEHHRCL